MNSVEDLLRKKYKAEDEDKSVECVEVQEITNIDKSRKQTITEQKRPSAWN